MFRPFSQKPILAILFRPFLQKPILAILFRPFSQKPILAILFRPFSQKPILAILFRPFGFLAAKLFGFQYFDNEVPDEGYSWNESCVLNLISTFWYKSCDSNEYVIWKLKCKVCRHEYSWSKYVALVAVEIPNIKMS